MVPRMFPSACLFTLLDLSEDLLPSLKLRKTTARNTIDTEIISGPIIDRQGSLGKRQMQVSLDTFAPDSGTVCAASMKYRDFRSRDYRNRPSLRAILSPTVPPLGWVGYLRSCCSFCVYDYSSVLACITLPSGNHCTQFCFSMHRLPVASKPGSRPMHAKVKPRLEIESYVVFSDERAFGKS